MIRAFAVIAFLQARGTVRRAMVHCRKPLQAVLLVVGAAFVLLIFLPVIFSGVPDEPVFPVETVRNLAPFAVLLFFLTTLLSPKNALSFSPPAVNFLFGAPFSLRMLLVYCMALGAGGTLLVSVFVAFGFVMLAGSWMAAWIAVALTGLYLFFLTLLTTLFKIAACGRIGRSGLKAGIAGGLALAALWVVFEGNADPAAVAAAYSDGGLVGAGDRLREIGLVALLLVPFEFLGDLLADRGNLARNGGVALGLCALLAGLAIAFPVDFREEAIRMSRHVEAARRKTRGGEMPLHTFRFFRPALPLFPSCWGAGAIAWRQLLIGLRRLPAILFVALAVSFPGLYIMFGGGNEDLGLMFVIGPLVFVTIFLASNVVTCDFRGDLLHIDALKSLPVRPVAVACGEVIAPVLVLTISQGVILMALGLLVPDFQFVALVLFAALIPANVVVICLENLGTLLFPVQARQASSDPVSLLRMMALGLAKIIASAVILGLAAGAGFLGYRITGMWAVAAAAGGCVVIAACVLLGWALAAAFDRFDPSRDVPI